MFVYDIDDLQSVSAGNTAERKKKRSGRKKSSKPKSSALPRRMKSLEVVPTILSLQEQNARPSARRRWTASAAVRQADPEQEAAIEAMTRGIREQTAAYAHHHAEIHGAEPEAAHHS